MSSLLSGKHIVLGITGSIAAYKACSLIRLLIKSGAEVQVIITPAGKEFITPVTLSALTSKPVISDFFSQRDGSWHSHVDLGIWADAMVIAPATASTIGKMAHGIADNMLITTYLSMKAPVFIAPAMDLDMYAHPATQNNIKELRSYGNHIIEATEGELASHLVGKGRMEEPEKILSYLEKFFENHESIDSRLKGKRILITAGPTHEKIDAVRFIGNYSTGKMGIALAESCAKKYDDSLQKLLKEVSDYDNILMQYEYDNNFVIKWLEKLNNFDSLVNPSCEYYHSIIDKIYIKAVGKEHRIIIKYKVGFITNSTDIGGLLAA